MSIYEDLLQNIPYPHRSEELMVNLLHTCAVAAADHEAFLKPYGLTGAQYNVLRILRGAARTGQLLGRNDIRHRMVDRMAPDMTRMLARMENEGLVQRRLHPPPGYDQRVVLTEITAKGLALLAKIDPAMTERHKETVAGITEQEQTELIAVLGKLRAISNARLQSMGGAAAENGDGGGSPQTDAPAAFAQAQAQAQAQAAQPPKSRKPRKRT